MNHTTVRKHTRRTRKGKVPIRKHTRKLMKRKRNPLYFGERLSLTRRKMSKQNDPVANPSYRYGTPPSMGIGDESRDIEEKIKLSREKKAKDWLPREQYDLANELISLNKRMINRGNPLLESDMKPVEEIMKKLRRDIVDEVFAEYYARGGWRRRDSEEEQEAKLDDLFEEKANRLKRFIRKGIDTDYMKIEDSPALRKKITKFEKTQLDTPMPWALGRVQVNLNQLAKIRDKDRFIDEDYYKERAVALRQYKKELVGEMEKATDKDIDEDLESIRKSAEKMRGE